jgi:hypothetical protein
MIIEFFKLRKGKKNQDMSETMQMLFAKNLICVCIESAEKADYQGLIYHQYADEPVAFVGMTDFLTKAEGLFDEWDFPQRGLAERSFKKAHKDQVGYKKSHVSDKLPIEVIQEQHGTRNVQNKKGTLGTFVVQVVYRQDATWQGHVIHKETNEKKDFASALELIMIIDSAVGC